MTLIGILLAANDAAKGVMEWNGVGPELFADRAKAWVDAFATIADTFLAKFGALTIATIALWQTIKTKARTRELIGRLDRQGKRIDSLTSESPPPPPE